MRAYTGMLNDVRACLGLLSPQARWRWAALIPLTLAAAAAEAVGRGGRRRSRIRAFTLLVMAFYVGRNALLAV